MGKIKINDLLGKSEKSVITVKSGNNKVKISDLKGNKKIRVADSEKVTKAQEAEKAYIQSIATKNRQLPTWQGFTPGTNTTYTAKTNVNTETNIDQPLAKSTSDLALDRAIANAREQANEQAWDEESLRLNRIKNDREKLLSYMTPVQKGQYNSTEQKGRDAYIKSIRDELNQKLGTDYAKEALELSEGDYLDRLAKTSALGMSSGLNMFSSGMKGVANAALDVVNGKDEGRKVTRSAAEYAYSALRPEVSGLQGAIGDTMQSTGNMLPSMAIGAATGGLGLPLSGITGTAAMGLASGGNSYDEAIKEGASRNKALLYGTANGVKEVLLQQIVGALPGINKADSVARKFIGKLGDKAATRILGDRAIKDTIVNIMANALSEGTEEAAQEAIETFLGNVILDRDEDYSLKDIAYSGLLGGITGAAFPAVGSAARFVGSSRGEVKGAEIDVNKINSVYGKEDYDTSTKGKKVGYMEYNKDNIVYDIDKNGVVGKNKSGETTDHSSYRFQPVETPLFKSNNNISENTENINNFSDFNEENVTEEESELIKDSLKTVLRAVNRNAGNSQQIYREIMTNNGYGDMVSKMDGIAKRLGSEVQFYADNSTSEGYNLGGKIYINVNNLRSTADGEWKVFKHELTHSLEGTKAYGDLMSSEAGIELYQEFLKNNGYTVTDENGKVTIAPEMLRDEIRERYARNGIKLNEEQLTNECIAKFVEESDILENEEIINRLASGSPNFAQKILRWIKDTLSKLGSDYETNRLRKAERLYEKALEQAEKGQFEYEKNAERKESIEENENGKYVKESRVIPFGEDKEGWKADVGQYIYDNILKNGKLDVIADNGEVLTIDGTTVYKLEGRDNIKTSEGTRKQNNEEYEKKLIMTGHIDELAEVSKQKNKKTVPDRKNHLFAKDGFNYRRAYFEDADGNYYRVTLSVGKNGKVQTVYNINEIMPRKKDITKVNGSSAQKGGAQSASNVFNKTLPQNKTKVNTEIGTNLGKLLQEAQEKAKFSINDKNETELTTAERKYIDKATNNLLNNFLEKVGADKYSDRASLKNEVRAFAEESVIKGRADKETTDKIFEKLFNETVIKDFSDYELYRKAAEEIKNTKLYGGGLGTQEGVLRRELFNKVRLVTDPTATKIDGFYKELSNKYPEIFDGDIANIDDQVRAMGDIVDRAKARQETLVEVTKILPQMYEEAKTGFENEVKNLNKEVKNVARHKVAREERINRKNTIKETAERVLSDKEYANEFYREKAKNQRAYEKLRGKELLTPEDIDAMNMMSKGVLTMENIENSSDQYNVDGIKRVYEAFKAKNEYDRIQKQIKNQSRAEKMETAEKAIANSDGWKEIGNGLKYSRNTMERIFEALTAKSNGGRKNAEAKMLIDTYIKPIHQNEADSTRLKNEFAKKVKDLGLSTAPEYTVSLENERTGTPMQVEVSESGLVQLLGEGLIDEGTLKRVGADVDKVTNAVKEFRGIYDELLDMANDVLVKNGYDRVQKRKDYFPHFTENKPDTTLGKIGAYFGIETNAELPTDIAGLTDTFRPGKKWVGNFLERNTDITDYDALKGFDRYLGSVADVIYHTDDIQRLRALETAIRYKYSDKGTKERINKVREDSSLTDEERNNQLNAIFAANEQSHLPNFVTELRDYTDNLAGKKNRRDRDWERMFGRNFYNTMKKLEGRVSANMVAINPGSWLTNFIPITQVSAITSNKSVLKAILDTERSYFKNDGFAERSDFLTNRRGSEQAYERSGFLGKVDKVSDVATKPFELIDNFASDVVTRALYNEAISKGMTETEAMDYANDMAARLMADRSKGAQPTIFDRTNPVTKLFTMFQTEVNNQYSYMFKDVPDELKKKGMGALIGGFFKMFLGAFLYNEIYEKFIGRRAAFDPIDIMMSTIGDFADPNLSNFNKVANLTNNIIDELPFVSGLSGGGRVPVSSALPDIGNLAEAVFDDDMASEKRAQQIGKELIKPAAYLAPPIGGGQIKKGVEALSVLRKGGEYTYDKDGNKKLKYAVENPSAGKYAQGLLFGKSSFKEAQDYYNSGSKILSAKQTQNYYKAVEAGLNFNQYKEALNAVKGIESDKDSNGKTIALSKAKKMKKAVDEAMKGYNLTKKQKEVLYDACGISNSVW